MELNILDSMISAFTGTGRTSEWLLSGQEEIKVHYSQGSNHLYRFQHSFVIQVPTEVFASSTLDRRFYILAVIPTYSLKTRLHRP